jgi:hypothetical protein
MSSVETSGRWLSNSSRLAEDVPSVMVNPPLDGGMDWELRYLSVRFGIHGGDLTRELLRPAPRDTFVVMPGDPIPHALLFDIHDAGLDPEEYRWFDLEPAAENGVSGREPEEGFYIASRDSREEGG